MKEGRKRGRILKEGTTNVRYGRKEGRILKEGRKEGREEGY